MPRLELERLWRESIKRIKADVVGLLVLLGGNLRVWLQGSACITLISVEDSKDKLVGKSVMEVAGNLPWPYSLAPL